MSPEAIAFLKRFKEISLKYEQLSKKKGEDCTIDEVVFLNEHKNLFSDVTSFITEKYLKDLNTIDKIKDFAFKNGVTKEAFNNHMILTLKHKCNSFLGREKTNQIVDADKNPEEKIKEFEEALNNAQLDGSIIGNIEDYKETILKTMGTYAMKSSSLKTTEGVIEFLESLEKEGHNIDDFLPDNDVFKTTSDRALDSDNYFLKDKLEDAKKGESKEHQDLLERASNIVFEADQKSVNSMSTLAEGIGKKSDKAFLDYIYEDQKNDKTDYSNTERQHTNIDYTNKVKTSTIVKNYTAATKFNVSLTEKEKNDLLEIYEDVKLIGEDYNLVELYTLKKAIKKDFEEKNFDGLKNNVEKYEKKCEIIDSALEKIDKIGSKDMFTGNISYAREKDLPAQYRNAFRNGTIFRTLGIFNVITKETGVTFEEALDDPIKAMQKTMSIIQSNNSITKTLNGNNLDEMVDLLHNPINANDINGKLIASNFADVNSIKPVCDAFMAIGSLLGGQKQRDISKAATISILSAKSSLPSYKTLNGNEINKLTSNLLIMDDKDRNCLVALNNKGVNFSTCKAFDSFNPVSYIRSGKTNAEKVSFRLMKVAAGQNAATLRSVRDSLKLTSDILLKNCSKQLNSYQKDALKDLSKGKVNTSAIQTYTKYMNTKEACAKGQGKDQLIDLISKQEEYNKKGFFSKIFNKETRALNAEIKLLKSSMQDYYKNDYSSQYDIAKKQYDFDNKELNTSAILDLENGLVEDKHSLELDDSEFERDIQVENEVQINNDIVNVDEKEIGMN